MSAFSSLTTSLHTTCLAEFGIPAVLHSQNAGDVQIIGIIQTPSMAEDFVPGSTEGVNVMRLFVDFRALSALIPYAAPATGDTITINGNDYTIGNVNVDVEGGAILKMRRR